MKTIRFHRQRCLYQTCAPLLLINSQSCLLRIEKHKIQIKIQDKRRQSQLVRIMNEGVDFTWLKTTKDEKESKPRYDNLGHEKEDYLFEQWMSINEFLQPFDEMYTTRETEKEDDEKKKQRTDSKKELKIPAKEPIDLIVDFKNKTIRWKDQQSIIKSDQGRTTFIEPNDESFDVKIRARIGQDLQEQITNLAIFSDQVSISVQNHRLKFEAKDEHDFINFDFLNDFHKDEKAKSVVNKNPQARFVIEKNSHSHKITETRFNLRTVKILHKFISDSALIRICFSQGSDVVFYFFQGFGCTEKKIGTLYLFAC